MTREKAPSASAGRGQASADTAFGLKTVLPAVGEKPIREIFTLCAPMGSAETLREHRF